MRQLSILFIFTLQILYSSAQTSVSIEQCDELFLKNNLFLLAEQYNIEASKAAVIQAKIWEQPFLSGEFNAINPQNNRVFDIGAKGQKALAIDQLIYLGGKKRKEVNFAKNNQELAELEYEQLIRSLRLELNSRFYELYFNQLSAASINLQIENLDTLIVSYSKQETKGNVSLKDVVRLQSLLLSLKSDLADIQNKMIEEQTVLKLITGSQDEIVAKTGDDFNQQIDKSIVFKAEELSTKALEKNPDYLLSKKLVDNSQLYLAWQKSLSIPDLTVGASYDQRGGAFSNQANLTFGIPLPLWNKNKGNIKISESKLDQSKTLEKQKELEIRVEIQGALKSFNYYQNQFRQSTSNQQNFETVYNGVLENFQKRNISLIEFTDFMESYNQSVMFLNEVKKQILLKGQYLNYLSAEKIY